MNNLEELCPYTSTCPYYKEGRANNPNNYQYCETYQELIRMESKSIQQGKRSGRTKKKN